MGDCGFEWLRGCAFVVRDGGRWRYHSVVRELMVRYQWQRSRSRWSLVHGKLAAFYEARRSALGLVAGKEAEDKIWCEYSLEWIYHTICAAPQASVGLALNGFLMALRESSEFALAWAKAIEQAGWETDSQSLRSWGNRLRDQFTEQGEEQHEYIISILKELLRESVIEENMRAIAFNHIGTCYLELNNSNFALNNFQEAIKSDSQNPLFYRGLIQACSRLKLNDEIILACKKAMQFNQDCYFYSTVLAHVYFSQKNYEEATIFCKQAILVKPECNPSHFLVARIYEESQNIEEAIKSYENARLLISRSSLHEDAINIYYRLIRLYFTQDSLGLARKTYESFANIFPAYAVPYLYIVFRDGMKEQSLYLSKVLVDLLPGNIDAHLQLGMIYSHQEKYDLAIKECETILTLDSTNSYACKLLGDIYREKNEFPNAIKYFAQTLTLSDCFTVDIENLEDENNGESVHSHVHMELGSIYIQQGEYHKAIVEYSQSIHINPRNKWAIGNRGQAYQALKHYGEALKDFDSTIELDSESSWATSHRGQIYQFLGQFELSLQDFDRSITLDPKDCEWDCYLRSLTLTKLDRPTEAQTDLQSAIVLAQAKQTEDRTDWQNNFNLALYYLVAGRFDESCGLYDLVSEASRDSIENAIRDLDDYLTLFPDRLQAREVCDRLSSLI